MNRAELQQLAEDRILDAAVLLAAGRWSGAYYLAGYAVECALKACILLQVQNTGAIFQDKKYAEKCWTHDLETLLALANLKPSLDIDAAANGVLSRNWGVAADWTETSRHEQKTQVKALVFTTLSPFLPTGYSHGYEYAGRRANRRRP